MFKRSPITRFEDLSNELLYEIFDFIDSWTTYDIFSNLNSRFNHLIVHSTSPLKLDFSLQSKAIFQYRCNTIVIPNVHRIISLQFSHHLLIDHFFKTFSLDTSFTRLEVFTLCNAESDHLIPILTTLVLLPHLHSLIITSIEQIESPTDVYSLILSLPVLKYCNLSFGFGNRYVDLLQRNSKCSPIENLVINAKCNLDQLNDFLIHTPRLNRLSCDISTLNNNQVHMSIISTSLTNLSLKLEDTSFDEFGCLISCFSHQLRILNISTYRDIEFLNADRWQQLILSRMPHLLRFNFRHRTITDESIDGYNRYHLLISKFKTSFWLGRKWFFTHQHYESKDFASWIIFYSINPYR